MKHCPNYTTLDKLAKGQFGIIKSGDKYNGACVMSTGLTAVVVAADDDTITGNFVQHQDYRTRSSYIVDHVPADKVIVVLGRPSAQVAEVVYELDLHNQMLSKLIEEGCEPAEEAEPDGEVEAEVDDDDYYDYADYYDDFVDDDDDEGELDGCADCPDTDCDEHPINQSNEQFVVLEERSIKEGDDFDPAELAEQLVASCRLDLSPVMYEIAINKDDAKACRFAVALLAALVQNDIDFTINPGKITFYGQR